MGSDDKKTKQQIKQGKRREVHYEALEPRVLLSADLLPLDIDPEQSQAVEELIVDVDLDQVEEASKFVIEGLDPVDVSADAQMPSATAIVPDSVLSNLTVGGSASNDVTISATGAVKISSNGTTTDYTKEELLNPNTNNAELILGSGVDELTFKKDTSNNDTDFDAGGNDDTFLFDGSTKLTGELDGGAGDGDTLSYASLGSSATINLQDGSYTGISNTGSVINVEIFEGSSKDDTFMGSTQADQLQGLGGGDNFTGGLGADQLTGGSGGDTYFYNQSAELAGDIIIEASSGSGDDTIDLSNLDTNLTYTVNTAGVAIDAGYEEVGSPADPDDTGSQLNLFGVFNAPTKAAINSGGPIEFALSLNGSGPATITIAAKDYSAELAALQSIADAKQVDANAANTGNYKVQYIAGQLLIENLDGLDIDIWQGGIVDGPGDKQGRKNIAVLKDLTTPEQSLPYTLTLSVQILGNAAATPFTVNNTYDQATEIERRKAWAKDIQNELNGTLNQPVVDITAEQDAAIDEQLEDLWLNDIRDAIESNASIAAISGFQAGDVSVTVNDNHTVLTVHYNDNADGINAIWANPAGAQAPAPVSNSLASVGNIENIKGGSQENQFLFTSIDQDLAISVEAGAAVALNFSGVNTALDVSIDDNGLVSITSNGHTITANNVSSLLGSDANDTYRFKNSATLALMGVGGGTGNIIDYSDYDLALDINLNGTAANLAKLVGVGTLEGGAAGIKDIIGGDSADTVVGNNLENTITGGSGADTLEGGGGIDILSGGDHDDTLRGGTGADILNGDNNNDNLIGGSEGDTLNGGAGDDTLEGEEGEDTLIGGANNDTLTGGAGKDSISGGAGNDTIIVGTGEGGTSNDAADVENLDGGTGNDTYQLANNWGHVTVIDSESNGGKDTIDFTAVTDAGLHILSEGKLTSGTGISDADITAQQDLIAGAISTGRVAGIDSYNFTDSLTVDTVRDIEKINLGVSDNTFLFGSNWGLKEPSATEVIDYITAWRNLGETIAIDNELAVLDNTDNGSSNKLVLDFRAVNQELKFLFKADGSLEISRVEDIEWIKRFLGDGLAELGADYVEWQQDKARWERGFEIEFNTIVISNVDANTTIYGGRNHNVFEIDEAAVFEGTVIGGTGLKPIKDNVFDLLEQNSTGLAIPEITDISQLTVRNELDMTGFGNSNLGSLNLKPGSGTSSLFNYDLSNWSNIDEIKFDPSGSLNVIIGGEQISSNLLRLNDTLTIDGGSDIASQILDSIVSTGLETNLALEDNLVADGTFTNNARLFAIYNLMASSVADNSITISGDYSRGLKPDTNVVLEGAGTLEIESVTYNKINNQSTIVFKSDIAGFVTLQNASGQDQVRFELADPANADASEINALLDKGTGFLRQINIDEARYKGFLLANQEIELREGGNSEIVILRQATVPTEFSSTNFGVSLLSGGTGGDTYKFEGGLWGVGAILEIPDVNFAGTPGLGLPEFFDTLDFSDLNLDLRYDIYQINSDNFDSANSMWQSLGGTASGDASELDASSVALNSNAIIVSVGSSFLDSLGFDAPTFLSWFGVEDADIASWGTFADGLLSDDIRIPLLFANDIENIVGSAGKNEVAFHGDAYLQGSLVADDLTLDYSDYNHNNDSTSGVSVSLGDGIDFTLIPDVTIPIIGTIEGFSATYGNADGVLGGRLGGLDQYIDFLTDLIPGDYSLIDSIAKLGITGFDTVVDTAGDDRLTGDGAGQTFELGNGGLDTIDGGGDSPLAGAGDTDGVEVTFNLLNEDAPDAGAADVYDIVSLNNSTSQVIVDLETGEVFQLSGAFDPQAYSDSAGSYRLDAGIAKTKVADLVDIEGAKGAKALLDLIIGTSGEDKFTIDLDDAGDVIIGNGGKDILDFSDLPVWIGVNVISDGAAIEAALVATGRDYTQLSRDGLKVIQFDSPFSDVSNDLVFYYGDAKIEGGQGARVVGVLKELPFIGKVVSLLDPSSAFAVNAGVPTGQLLDNTLLSSTAFTDLVEQGRQNWRDAVGDTLVDEYLSDALLTFSQSDLTTPTDATLANVTGTVDDGFGIALDTNAAGYGWYIGTADTVPADQFDLLTVLMHEMGHILGIEHDAVAPGDLLAEFINPGERLLPDAAAYDIADQQLLADGLLAFEGWVSGLGSRALELLDLGEQNIPFIDIDIADLLGIPDSFASDIGATVGSAISDQLGAIFGGDITAGDIINIPGVTSSITSTGSKAFKVNLDLLGNNAPSVNLDLSSLSFDGVDIGFGDLPISIENAPNLEILTNLTLDFEFGLDEQSQFFISSPTLDGGVRIVGQDLNTEISLFDLVGAKLDDGLIDISTGLQLTYPETLSLQDLQANTINVSSLNPSWGGDNYYEINLPISLTGAFEGLIDGIALTADSAGLGAVKLADGGGLSPVQLLASLPFTLQLEGFDDLSQFQNVSIQQLMQALLDTLDSWLDADNENSPLFKTIPGVNQSIDDLLGNSLSDIRNGLMGIVTTIETYTNLDAATAAVNTEVSNIISSAFGLDTNYAHPDYFAFAYQDNQLTAELDIAALFSDTLTLDLSLTEFLDDLGLNDLGIDLSDTLSITANAELETTAFAELFLGVGADLDFLSTPLSDASLPSFNDVLYVKDGSGLRLGAGVRTLEPFDAQVSISLPDNVLGGIDIGIYVIDAELDATIEAFVGLQSDDGSPVYLSELSDALSFDINADISADLPLFFPTETMPFGGTDEDLNFDGIADNTLSLRGSYDKDAGFDFDISDLDFSNAFSLYAFLNDPVLVKAALNGFFDGVTDLVEGQFLGFSLPFVGDAFGGAAAFVDDLRNAMLGTDIALPGGDGSLLGFLDNAIANDEGIIDTIIDALSDTIVDSLGPDGAGLLQVNFDLDSGEEQFDEFGNPLYSPVAALNATQRQTLKDNILSASADGLVFNFTIGEVFVDEEIGLDFGVSLPGLALNSDAGIDFTIDYLFGIGLGINGTNGLYLDTSGVTASGEELIFEVEAALQPGSTLDASLGLLEAMIEEYDDGDGRASGLSGRFTFDLDGGDDGIWDIGNESLGVEARLVADADVDLFVEGAIGIADDGRFGLDALPIDLGFLQAEIAIPEVSTIFHYNQTFADIVLGSNGNSFDFGGSPTVILEDVTIEAGELIGKTLKPVLETIAPIIAPLYKVEENGEATGVIALFEESVEIPGVGEVSLLSFAESIAAGDIPAPPNVRAVLQTSLIAINAIKEFAELIALLDGFDESGSIVVGTFELGSGVLAGDDYAGQRDEVMGSHTQGMSADDQLDSQGQKTRDVIGGLNSEGGSFEISLLQDPFSALGFLLGENVDIFRYTLPSLIIDFKYQQSFPIYPGLNARLGGEVNFATNFAFGLDSSGINAFIEDTSSPEKLFNGFFIADWDSEGTDIAEITFDATIKAGASVGLGGLIEAGVEGGVNAQLDLNLNDPGAPDDGKIYLEEFIDLLDDPECIFDVSGELSAFLDAFFWVGVNIFGGEITIFEARDRFLDEVIFSFDYSCPDSNDSVGAVMGDRLVLQFDPEDGAPGDDAVNYNVTQGLFDLDLLDPLNQDENLVNDVDNEIEREYIIVSANGTTRYFEAAGINSIELMGTDKNDTLMIDRSVTKAITVRAEAGKDRISVAGEGRAVTIYGGAGADLILGSDGADTIYGEDETGGSEAEVNAEGDRILGDVINSGGGEDTIYAGSGNDIVNAGDDRDEVYGGTGDDRLLGMAGNDMLYGDEGDDYLHGGEDTDDVFGDAGFDTIVWYSDEEVPGADEIIDGGANDDRVRMFGYKVNPNFNPEELNPNDPSTFQFLDTNGSDNVELSASGSNIVADWGGSDITFVDAELVDIDTGAGSDNITVNDLSSTTLKAATLIAGSSRETRTVAKPELSDGDIVYQEKQAVDVDGVTLLWNPDGTPQIENDVNGNAVMIPVFEEYLSSEKSYDQDADTITLLGGSGVDAFTLSNSELAGGDPETGSLADVLNINHNTIAYSLQELDGNTDTVVVDGQGEDDNINASALTAVAATDLNNLLSTGDIVTDLRLIGSAGNDTIVGSDFHEVIIGGAGADTITGGRSVDDFVHADYSEERREMLNGELVLDTLIESNDGNFLLTDQNLVVTLDTVTTAILDADAQREIELLDNVFERIELYGGEGRNNYTVKQFTYDAILDGAYDADNYIISLTGIPERDATVRIADSDTNIFTDSVTLLGDDDDGAYVFDADRSDPNRPVGFIDRYYDKQKLTDVFQALDANALAENIDDDAAAGAAAATTARRIDAITDPKQTLIYEAVESLKVLGRGGDDLFIVDDSTLALEIEGEDGNDEFFIGRVVETAVYTDPITGRQFTYVSEITNGVTETSSFFGGVGDDYFEVNHNVAEIFLYGEDGDDTFYLKAHLELKDGVNLEELGTDITLTGGDIDGKTAETDTDSLFSYVKNNKVHIFGGGGFDSLVIGGTDADDEFYIFVEEDEFGNEVQRVYGAGLVIETIRSVERFILVTGAGDDTIYVNGTLQGQQLLINTGSSFDPEKGDRVIFGGEAQEFDITLPASVDSQQYAGDLFLPGPATVREQQDYVALNKITDASQINQADWQQFLDKYYDGFLFSVLNIPFTNSTLSQLGFLANSFIQGASPRDIPAAFASFYSVNIGAVLYDNQFAGFSLINPYNYWYTVASRYIDSSEFVNDLMDLFYRESTVTGFYDIVEEVERITDTNVTLKANLPTRVIPGYMPENYDLAKIQGEVQVIGSSTGQLTLEINHSAENSDQTSGVLKTELSESVQVLIDFSALDGINEVDSGNINSALIVQDLQDTIRRNHKIADIGLIDRMLVDTGNATDISLFAGQQIQVFADNALTDLASYLSAYGYSLSSETPEQRDVVIKAYEKDLNGAASPVGFTTTESYGTRQGFNDGQLQEVSFAGAGQNIAAADIAALGDLLEAQDLLFDYYYTHSTYATQVNGRGLYEVWVYRSELTAPLARIGQANIISYDNYLENGGNAADWPQENGEPLLSWFENNAGDLWANDLSLRGLPADVIGDPILDWPVDNNGVALAITDENVAAYVSDRFGLQESSSIMPVTKTFEQEIYTSSDAGAVNKIRVVRTPEFDTDGFEVEVNGVVQIDKVRVYADDVLTLAVPNGFVTGKGADTTSNTFDTVQGFGTASGIFYRNVDNLELNLDANRDGSESATLIDNTVYIEDFFDLGTVNINSGVGDDIIRVAQPVVQENSILTTADDIWLYDQLIGISAEINIDGQQGNDKLYFSTENNANSQSLNVEDSRVDGMGMSASGANYTGIELLRVTLGENQDDIVVNSTHQLTLTQIDGRGGADTAVVAEDRNVEGVRGELRFDLGNGINDLLIDDVNDSSGDNIDINAYDLLDPDNAAQTRSIGIEGVAQGNIYYRADGGFLPQDGLVLRAGSGNNRIDIRNIHNSDHTEVYAGANDDTVTVYNFDITGRSPTLTIYGEAGSDFIDASLSPIFVSLFGNLPGQNVTEGMADEDILIGSEYDDIIEANGGNDIVIGNFGNDKIDSGDGDDISLGDRGAVVMTNPLAAGVNGQRVSVSSTDNEVGGRDTIMGGNGDDLIIGGAGSDIIDGGSGNDGLIGDVGVARYNSGVQSSIEASPFFIGAQDNITGGAGEDTLLGGVGKDILTGNFLDDTIIGYYGRLRFDPDGSAASLIIMGIGRQDLVASSLGELYYHPVGDRISTRIFNTEINTPDTPLDLDLANSLDAELFKSSDLSIAALGTPQSQEYVISLGFVPNQSQQNIPLGSYRVAPGDTLSEIMPAFGLEYPVDIQPVLDLNPFISDPDQIQSGWIIKLIDEQADETESVPAVNSQAVLNNAMFNGAMFDEGMLKQTSEQADNATDALAAAAIMMGLKVHAGSTTASQSNVDRSMIEALDNKARKRRFARWDGRRVVEK